MPRVGWFVRTAGTAILAPAIYNSTSRITVIPSIKGTALTDIISHSIIIAEVTISGLTTQDLLHRGGVECHVWALHQA